MLLRTTVLAGAILQIVAALWFGAGMFETGAREYPVYIQPAGWAFAIWGVIFTLSLAYAVYQFNPQNDNQTLRATRIPAIIAFFGSIAWLWAAGQSGWLIWSTIPILFGMASALCFVVIQPRLASEKAQLFSQSILLPYAAWTGIAQWLNIQALVNAQGIVSSGVMNITSNVLLLICISIFAIFWLHKARYSIWYGGVIIWATIGVIANNHMEGGSFIIIAMAGALCLTALVLIRQQGFIHNESSKL